VPSTCFRATAWLIAGVSVWALALGALSEARAEQRAVLADVYSESADLCLILGNSVIELVVDRKTGAVVTLKAKAAGFRVFRDEAGSCPWLSLYVDGEWIRPVPVLESSAFVKKPGSVELVLCSKLADWRVTERFILKPRSALLERKVSVALAGEKETALEAVDIVLPNMDLANQLVSVPGFGAVPMFVTLKDLGKIRERQKSGLEREAGKGKNQLAYFPVPARELREDEVFLFHPLRGPSLRPPFTVFRDPIAKRSVVVWGWSETVASTAMLRLRGDGRAALVTRVLAGGRIRPGETVDCGGQFILVGQGELFESLAALPKWYGKAGLTAFGEDDPAERRRFRIFQVYAPDAGGFKGIQRALPSIRDLGFNALYLMPCWAPNQIGERFGMKNPGWGGYYFWHDCRRLDTPRLGSEEDFKSMVATAHGIGMKVIMDFCIQGCSPESPLVGEHPDWFERDKGGNVFASHGWGRVRRGGLRTGTISFDWANEEYQDFMAGVACSYVEKFGVDGYRIDAPSWKEYNWSRKIPYHASHASLGGVRLVERVRKALDARGKGAFLIAESSGPVFTRSCDLLYDYPFRNQIRLAFEGLVTARDLKDWLALQRLAYPEGTVHMRFSETHDTWLQDQEGTFQAKFGIEASKAAFAAAAMAKGALHVFYKQVRNSKADLGDFYKRILNVRSSSPALDHGDADYRSIVCSNENVFTVLRFLGDEWAVPVINFSNERVECFIGLPADLPGLDAGSTYEVMDLMSGTKMKPGSSTGFTVRDLHRIEVVPAPYQVMVLRVRKVSGSSTGPGVANVIAGIPFTESPAGGFAKPTWKEVEDALLGLKETGVDTIFLWAPYEHRVPGPGETVTAHTANGDVELALKHCVHIKDYLKPDPDRGTEKEFLRMIVSAHALGLQVMAQLQVTISNPGDYIHDRHPEWMLKSVYGKPAVVWPWKPFGFGFLVNKAHPGLVDFVAETVIPHWVKKWGVDGIFLDSPGMPYCDGHIMKIGERAGCAKGFECLTPVKGRFSPEPLVKAMKSKLKRLGNEIGKRLVFAAEDPLGTWRDLPDRFIGRICKGRPNMFEFSLHPEVDRSLGKQFAWVHDYNFRSVLKGISEGKGDFSRSAEYVKVLRMRCEAEAESADTTKFVNMWCNTAEFFGLLKPRAAGCNITLAATAPGGILWIGAYQLPPQCGAVGRIGGYEPETLDDWYRKLIRIKREHPALRSRNIEDALVSPDAKGLIAYNRWCEGESITVVVNTTGEDISTVVKTRFGAGNAHVVDLLTGEPFTGKPESLVISAPAHSPRILAPLIREKGR